ncbi:MAG: ABC transporter ATP-binding protein [Candidatus Dadabacteria bacterium]|nr:ABC transporter ATP-binding protein [Candidatus Dadabacteria bacterium]NIS08434.1 ABC transporter ATP-binding protein [Candidatus Dadabacteria bacterium]NIV41999.1 ATP-binding cassette domain-containing protein [Candidatus Dadabacteria bacterium]NIY21922.1 ATP-binding cassette domain-containing protein [Candidatus Dadabacteria bacterium]
MTEQSHKKSLRTLLLKYKYSVIAGLLALTVVDLCQLSVPIIIQRVVDTLTTEDSTYSDLNKYAVYILILAALMSLFRFGWRYFLMGASRKLEQSLRNEFFAHLQSLDFDFFNKRKIGDLMAHTVNDIETIRMACGLGMIIAYDGIFLLIFIMIAMLYISPELTLYAFIPFPLLGLIIYRFGRFIEAGFTRIQESFSELTESARTAISGIKVLKAYVAEDDEKKKFEKSSSDYLDKNLRLIKVWTFFQPLITLIAGIAIVIFIWLGGIKTITTEISLGDFAAMLVYLTMLSWPMMALAWAYDLIKRATASLNRINEVFAVKPKPENLPALGDFKLDGDIEFRNLSFSYNGKKALDNLNLTIPKGSKFGITGRTASGKTTLIELIMKIPPVPESQIFINGTDLADINKNSLRKQVIYIPQETTVFSGTVRDNITFMKPDIDQAEIERVVKIAEIYDDIKNFPEGFDTRVGERGLSLSGGQRQRIALARAILFKPEILILDDVLSSLDLRTEKLALANIVREMKGRTLIAVSSRVPSISGFSQIAVFDGGRLIETGNHSGLMSNDGIYASLYKIQTIR